jgi:hypothetical protein
VPKKPKVMITARAAKQRINRALKPTLQSLKTARTPQAIAASGRHYVIDHRKNYMIHHDVDLETFGQDLGVIAKWETVEDE